MRPPPAVRSRLEQVLGAYPDGKRRKPASLVFTFGNLTLTWQAEQTRLSEADTLDVRLCPRGPHECRSFPSFLELSLRAGVRVGERVLLSVAIENLLDKAYRTYASGAYAPGRNFVAALRVSI